MPRQEPLTRLQAMRHWSRDSIREYAFPQPPRMKSQVVARPKPDRKTSKHRAKHVTAPGLPAAGDITVAPDLVLPHRKLQAAGRPVDPLFVYPPDGRHVFKDTSYPWRACGRVTTNGGQGSGTLVGPRHLLTASHVIDGRLQVPAGCSSSQTTTTATCFLPHTANPCIPTRR
jgi:V8-like Glu-specific endopeptidase